MQTLIPNPVKAPARHSGRWNWLSFTLTPRAIVLFGAGCLLAIPAFFHPRWIWLMLAWDIAVLLLAALDAVRLPRPALIEVERRFGHSPVLGEATDIAIEITQRSNHILDVRFTDALHPALDLLPGRGRVLAYPRDPVACTFSCTPNLRGDFALGPVYLRYRGALRLAERWAVVPLAQRVRVFPPMERSPDDTQLYLLRIRQIALQKRRLRLRGLGREFESLREYQRGDELRNIAWPATARRGKLITREFTTERSQQVWIVLDAGRLSGTAYELRRTRGAATGFHNTPGSEAMLLTLTQLDQASGAAIALAQTVMQAGDKAALLVYGRGIQQQILPGSGASHLRLIVDALSQIRPEAGEANHLIAAARLKTLQRRRSLVLWITELADSARRPEVVDAAIDLARRHLVLLVVLGHPELEAVAARQPASIEQMYTSTAASEILDRRRELVATLRARGVLVIETTPGAVKADAMNEYLEVKARGLL